MEKFTGISKKALNELKLDFTNFAKDNFGVILNLYQDELVSFNNNITGIAQNYLGSPIQEKHKYGLYDALFATYSKIRLSKLTNSKLGKADQNIIEQIIAKLGTNLDKTLARSEVKQYREEKREDFINVITRCFNVDRSESLKQQEKNVANFLEELASTNRANSQVPTTVKEIEEYYLKTRQEIIEKIDCEAKRLDEMFCG